MCGIAGVRALSGGGFATDALRRMAELMRHRGPDGSTTWVGQDIGLVHTRLEVGDGSPGPQPVHSVDGRWVLAFDGRVTNRDGLRVLLDYPFRTGTDAEVVVAGLALDGISFLERVEGPFALVAHDLRTDATHLVRDRLGSRPLHYRHVPGGIAFASEVKALLTLGPPPQVDRRSLDAYLGTRAVPAPDTLFEGVKKVRPAHRVSVMARGHVEESHYWDPPPMDPEGTWTVADAVEAVGDGVREAVRSALDGELPTGALLSPGLGSSLLVAQAHQLMPGEARLHTFSADVEGGSPDDLWRTRRLSALLGTQHHEVRVRRADFADLWAGLTWHREAPLSGPADIVAYGVARAAREHVRVALSGSGVDEIFGGGPEHAHARAAQLSDSLPARLRSALGRPAEPRQGAARQAPFTARERQRLLGTPPPPERRTPPVLGADPLDRMLRQELVGWVPDHLLEPDDRMSMAASLEVRHALLDHRLVELAFRLPSSVKVRGRTAEWVLGEVARPLLPVGTIDRRPPGGRRATDPFGGSLLRDTAREQLTAPGSWVGQTLEPALVRQVVERHARGAGDVRLWTLLCLEMWHECFFGPPPAVPSPRSANRVQAGARFARATAPPRTDR